MIRYFPPGGRSQPVSGISDIGSGGRPTSGNLFTMGRPYGQVAPRSAYTGPVTITPADVYREAGGAEQQFAERDYLTYLDEQNKLRRAAMERDQELMGQYNDQLAAISSEFESRYGSPATEEYLSAYGPKRPNTLSGQAVSKSFSDFLKTWEGGRYKVNPEGKLYTGTLGVGTTTRLPMQQPQQQPRPIFGTLGRALAPRPAMSSYAAR